MPSNDPRQAFSDVILRTNAAGTQREHWFHRAGCGGWFVLDRDTLTDEVVDAVPSVRR